MGSGSYIIVVDNDEEFTKVVAESLQRANYRVDTAKNGLEGLNLIQVSDPDLVILDISMPIMDGIAVCSKLRENPSYNRLPILFLSGMKETPDVIKGLDAGGDDYVSKPVPLSELEARVRALLRRSNNDGIPRLEHVITAGDLTLDSQTYLLETPHSSCRLTKTEHRLMRYFMEHANHVLSPHFLLEAVWFYPQGSGDPDLVRAHVRKIRTKCEKDPNNPRYIETVHGLGYKLNPSPENR